jgi:O-antigen/teichoic acid export membrane protein
MRLARFHQRTRLLALLPYVDQAVVSAGNFGTGVVLARALEQQDFGVYVLASLGLWVLLNFQNGLTLRPLVLLGASLDHLAFSRLLRASLVIQIVFIACATTVLTGVALAWEPLRGVVVPLVVAASLTQAQELCRRVLYTRGRIGGAALNNAINYDLQVLALAVVGLSMGLSIASTLWIVAATSLLAALFGAWQLRSYLNTESDDPRQVGRRTLEIGKWTAGSLVLTTFSWEAYPAIIQTFHGLASTAGLGVIRQILGPVHLLTRPLDTYYLPRAVQALAREGSSGIRRVLWQAARLTGPPYLMYLLVLASAPQLVIGRIYGETYVQYADAARLFALAELLVLPLSVLILEASARRLQRSLLLANVWSAFLLSTVGVLAVASFGLNGAALSMAASMAGQIAIVAIIVVRARRREAAAAGQIADPAPEPERLGTRFADD